jgi:hypothetical protein
MRESSFRTALIACLATMVMFACSKGEDDKGGEASNTAATTEGETKPDEAKPDEAKPDEAKPDEAKPDEAKPDEAEGGAEQAQCQKILEKSWDAVLPVLARVGAEPAQLEKNYKADKTFIERCVQRDATVRDCLEKSENPIAGIHECGANPPNATVAEKLWAPSISPRQKREEAPPEKQAELLASVVGTWTSDWKSFKQKTTWKIAASGAVDETKVREGKSENKTLEFAFPNEREVKVQTTPTSSQWYSFLRVDNKTFLASSNGAYSAFAVEDKDKFLVWTKFDWLSKDGDTCMIIESRGLEVEAKCEWKKEKSALGKNPVLRVKYQAPGRNRPDGQPLESELTYHYVAGHLIDHRMIDVGTFKKK